MYLPFEEMPDHARIWVYQSDRKLTPEEEKSVSEKLRDFCQKWNTHGTLMPTSYDIKLGKFIILAVDESQLGASGCSIDSSVKTLKTIEDELGLNLLNRGKVSYMDGEEVATTTLPDIKNHITSGKLVRDTYIFNPVVEKKQDLEKKWMISAEESWLNKYFNN
ncbi:hypothetical protein [Anditalea andensis]|uniref:ABC transporter ATPase n=1 Tax=Anditalea andensis TaxID=1048983 RepID=A0A074KWR3_9BACT|nr:hypothetical protein [Anditalea andensis]KEO73399.1 hypothetical protein EL17_13745 [Anditalea andensis]